jgi:hypothetical protein
MTNVYTDPQDLIRDLIAQCPSIAGQQILRRASIYLSGLDVDNPGRWTAAVVEAVESLSELGR